MQSFRLLLGQWEEDTLLIRAARLGKEDFVLLLLNAGAAVRATNKVVASTEKLQMFK